MSQQIKNTLAIYRRATFRVFTGPGLLFTLIFLFIFALTNIIHLEFTLFGQTIELMSFSPLNLLLAIITSFLTMGIWWFIGTKYAPRIGTFLTENKIGNLIFTKGDIHYFEKIDREELKITPGIIIAKLINLLMVYLSVTAFLLGFYVAILRTLDPTTQAANALILFFQATSIFDMNYIIKIIIVFVFAPILLTVVIPIPWMLIDAKLKSYNSTFKINNMVGKAVQKRLTPLFAIGGLVTLLINNLDPNVIISLIFFILVFLVFPSFLMVTLYNMLFQVSYYESFLREIPVPFGTTKIEMEVKFKKVDTVDLDVDELKAKDQNEIKEVVSDEKEGIDKEENYEDSNSNNEPD